MPFLLEVYLDGKDLEVLPETASFWYDETIYGASTYQLHATSNDWTKWDTIVTSSNPRAKLRWGYQEEVTEKWAGWKDVLLTPTSFSYSLGLVTVQIDSTDAGYVLAEASHNLPFVRKRVSDMVTELAALHGLKSRVEETQGLFTLYQGTLNDAAFIAEVLLAHAVSSGGRADYNFYVEDGRTLVFEPVDLSSVQTTLSVRDGVRPPRGDDIEVLEVKYENLFQSAVGSAATELRGFNSRRKELLSTVVNETTADYQYLAKRPPIPQTGLSAIQVATSDTKEEVDLVSKATWSRNARALFRTEVTLGAYDQTIRPGHVVKLSVFSPDEAVHWTAGRWIVWKVRQWYRPKGYGTTLFLERRAHE